MDQEPWKLVLFTACLFGFAGLLMRIFIVSAHVRRKNVLQHKLDEVMFEYSNRYGETKAGHMFLQNYVLVARSQSATLDKASSYTVGRELGRGNFGTAIFAAGLRALTETATTWFANRNLTKHQKSPEQSALEEHIIPLCADYLVVSEKLEQLEIAVRILLVGSGCGFLATIWIHHIG